MAIPMRQDQQQDADAVYIHDRIANADRLEAEGKAEEQSGSTKRKQAEQERIQAGLRLIEVRARYSDKKPSEYHTPGWLAWLEANQIAQPTAHRLMKLAGSDEEQRDEQRKKERDRKRKERGSKKEFKLVWNLVLIEALGMNVSRAIKRGYKSEVEALMGEEIPSHFTSEDDADAFVERYIAKVGLPDSFKREQLPKSSEEKVQRAIRVETGLLRKQFHDAVEQGIEAQLEQRIAHVKMLQQQAEEAKENYNLRAAGIAPIITKDDYRFLLNTLHSDRVPTTEKMDKAFGIVKKLEPYIESF